MKILISFDMEGVAGIVDWDQCRPAGHGYDAGCRLLLGEVNAAIDGAIAGGADEIVCNDAHGTMANLPADELHGRAVYLAGRHKPRYMMQGIDDEVDAVLFVGYHGSISGSAAVLSHTYNPAVITRVELNGTEVGESGINALVALAHHAPIAFVSGDQAAVEQCRPWAPEAVGVVVKDSITRYAAANLHPLAARDAIAAGAEAAVKAAAGMAPPPIALPARLDVDVLDADMAEVASWVKGVERTGTRRATIEGGDPAAVFASFVGLTYITRVARVASGR